MIEILWQKQELLLSLVKRDLKARYKSSVLGFFWSIGRPLFLSLIIIIVFQTIFRFPLSGSPPPPYALHILAGILPWFFFVGTVSEAVNSILANGNLVKKIRIPTEVIPVAVVCSNLLHFALALVVYHGFYLIYGHFPGWELLLLPLVVLIQVIFIAALALLVASLNVYFRDIGSITEIALNAWFYLTPVLYSVSLAREQICPRLADRLDISAALAGRVFWLYYLNPMAAITVAYRRLLLLPSYPTGKEMPDSQLIVALMVSLAISLICYFVAVRVFRRLSPCFADQI
ncbi:ABC transporter permease [Candidatus Sumerlaeota bacterium]